MKPLGSKFKPAAWAAVLAVLCAPAAKANNTQTVNGSDVPLDLTTITAFTPLFVQTQCTAVAGGTGNCDQFGAVTAGNAGGTTIIYLGGTEAPNGYFNNPDMMPVLNLDVWSGGIAGAAWNNAAPFSSGLMSWDRSDGSSYFAGLTLAWTGYADAAANPTMPMGAPLMPGGAESVREEWVDQTVVSWVETLDALGNTTHVQNFRNRLSWMGSDVATSWAHVDQRWEQLLMLDPNGLAFEASRQTIQQAFAVGSPTGATTDPDGIAPAGTGQTGQIGVDPAGWNNTTGVAQLVTQDVEGWFYSCLSCDSQNRLVIAFTPMFQPITFMPFDPLWINVPSISHGASGGNMTAFGF
ncbi:MAG: hypothetical protein HZA24_09390 [Nitrospirae bacterium]|nr:hypothetical protein [Nitrospirota bacterium]